MEYDDEETKELMRQGSPWQREMSQNVPFSFFRTRLPSTTIYSTCTTEHGLARVPVVGHFPLFFSGNTVDSLDSNLRTMVLVSSAIIVFRKI